jgi:hypothetical protein
MNTKPETVKYVVTLNNEGGELASGIALTPEHAAQVAIAMIEATGSLQDGDTIKVREIIEMLPQANYPYPD